MDPGFAVRRMTRDELPLIRAWADAEGWNPGTLDAAAFHAADPDGFFVGTLNGDPVACVSCVAYDAAFGFLGQYIVRPGYRGRGFGLAVWNAGMAHLSGRVVGLDGVLNQQENYTRSGFRFAHQHVRYGGTGGGDPSPDTVPLSRVPFDQILAFDRTVFPAPRPTFLAEWLTILGAAAVGVLGNGSLGGYGVIRPSSNGYKIGPLFAVGPGTADAIFQMLVAHAAGHPFVIDVPDDTANPAAGELARRYGLAEQFRTARMYTGTPPAFDPSRVYGVTSLELG